MMTSSTAGDLKLKSSLQKSAIFPIVLAIMVTLGLFVRSQYVRQARDKLTTTQDAMVVVMEFTSATSSLISGDSAMNLELWDTKYKTLESFLVSGGAKGLVEPYVVSTVRNEQEHVRNGLQQLVNVGFVNSDKPRQTDRFDDPSYRKIVEDMAKAMASMMDGVSREILVNRYHLGMIERLANNILLVFVGVFSMLMAAATIAQSRSAVSRLKGLKVAAIAAAEGNYSHRIGELGPNDEIGQTLRIFNTMLSKFNDMYGRMSGELKDVKEGSTASRRVIDATKESNMRLADALTRLKRAQGQVVEQERLRALQQVANGMAKDFANAITPVLSASDYLLSYPEHRKNEEELLENLNLIRSSAEAAHTQVRRLSAVFNREDAAEQCVDLKKVVDHAIQTTEARRLLVEQEKGIKISCVSNLAYVPSAKAQEADMEDAIIGILVNAFESFNADGEVNITMEEVDGKVVLTISDSGCGMTPEMCGRAIEPFFSTKGADYSGMGLTTAMTAAGQYGGAVDVASEESRGTVVEFRLPICSEEQKQILEQQSDTSSGLKILVVDDEIWISKILDKCLSSDGHEVETALNGSDGLAKLQEGNFDLAILDWALPDTNGAELARRCMEITPDTRIVILSGFGDSVQKEGLVPEGVRLVLSKPVTINELRRAVQKAMS